MSLLRESGRNLRVRVRVPVPDPSDSGSQHTSPKSAAHSPFTDERMCYITGRRLNKDSVGAGLAAGKVSNGSTASLYTASSSDTNCRQSIGGSSHGGGGGGDGVDVDDVHDPDLVFGTPLGLESRESRGSGVSSVVSSAAPSSLEGGPVGVGSSKVIPPQRPEDKTDLPSAPGRFLSWLPRDPTLEGTLEKRGGEGYFGSTLRLLGMARVCWKLRHFVLYDNHLFWGRGFSRMYGYGTVLSARPSPEDGETALMLELMTHPKFSLRRGGGHDSLDYLQRVFGLCCSTHGYSQRILRAGTAADRDRWIMACQRGMLPLLPQDGSNGSDTPAVPTLARSEAAEASVFGSVSPPPGDETVDKEREQGDGGGGRGGGDGIHRETHHGRIDRAGNGGGGGSCQWGGDRGGEGLKGHWTGVQGRRGSEACRKGDLRSLAREISGMWTPRSSVVAEEAAASAWEAAAKAVVEVEHQACEQAAAEEAEMAWSRVARTAATVVRESSHTGEASATPRQSTHVASNNNGGEDGDGGGGDGDGDGDGDGGPPSVSSSTYATADGDSIVAAAAIGAQLARRGDGGSVPAEWLAIGAGGTLSGGKPNETPASTLRRHKSVELKPPMPVLRKKSSLTNSSGSSDWSGDGKQDGPGLKRKVSFRKEVLEETKLYMPTPTKRNPAGVGRTPSRQAPFAAGPVCAVEADGSGVGVGFYSQQRALRQAAGRWVIPPEELKLSRRIGSGSFGEVFIADWNGTEVALKQMHDKSLTGAAVQEFSGEIRMMQGLRHPNIVLFLGAVIHAPTLSIVCELMPLGSLHSLLHGKAWGGVELSGNGRLRRQMAQDCARGMSYLHSRSPPVVHHDLKPANLLVDSHWTLKVSDFGMSRLKHNTYLSCKSPGGTPEWMAPEVLRNDPTDERSDIYSFAVILWELITLQYPWEELSSPVQIVVQVAFLHRRPKLPTWLPPEVVSLVQACWAREPSGRPSFTVILESLKAEFPEAWADRTPESSPPNTAVCATAERAVAVMSEKKATLAADSPASAEAIDGSGTPTPRRAQPAVVVGALSSSSGDFMTLRGLRPIKTPAPMVTRNSGPSESESSEEDGEGTPGAQGCTRGKRSGMEGGDNGNGGGGRGPRDRVSDTGVAASPSMAAAGAYMPNLPTLKIGVNK